MKDLFAPPSEDELAGEDLFAPPSDDELGDDKEASGFASGVRKLAQGASAGFSDEIAGGIEAAGRVVGLKGAGGAIADIGIDQDGPSLDWEVLKDAYKRARDKERSVLKKDSKDNPAISNVAEIGGAIVSPLSKLMPGASLVKSGAVIGGTTGLGMSESEDLGGMAKDTITGAGLGGAVGKLAQVGAPLLQIGAQATGEGARNLAKRFGARALGAERATVKKLGRETVDDLGAYALDENLLSPLASTEDVIARNAAKAQEGGAMMGKVYDQIDEAGASTFNPQRAAETVNEEIGAFWRSPINRGETKQLENTLESIMMRGEGNIPLREAQALKQELGKVANWKNNLTITDKEKMARDAYGIVSKQIDEAVETGAAQIGSQGLMDTLKQGKQLFGNAKGAEELLKNKFARELGNKMIGLTDTIAAGGAAQTAVNVATGGTAVLATGGVLAAKKGLERFGAQNAALGLNKISKALMKSPQMAELAQKNPAAFAKIAEQLESRMSPEAFPRAADTKQDSATNFNESHGKDALLKKTQGSKYAQALQNAAAKGDQSLSAAHYVLSQRDPEYKKLTDGEDGF